MNPQETKNEAEEIRSKYLPAQRTKLDELRQLDGKVRFPATVFAYIFGIIGALVLGVGMCLAMQVIGELLGTAGKAVGVVVGVVGIAMLVANYFIYRTILNQRKKKYGKQVLSLSDELLSRE